MRNQARITKDASLRGGPRNAAKSLNHAVSGPRHLRVVVTAGRRPRVGTPTPIAAMPLVSETAPSPALIIAAAEAASANVTLVADSMGRAAEALRQGDWKTGRCLLAQSTATVRTLLLVTDMLASIPGRVLPGTSSLDVVVTCLSATLSTLESKRLRGDWDGVVSILEDDITALLAEWSSELHTLGGGGTLRLVPGGRVEASNRVAMNLPEAG